MTEADPTRRRRWPWIVSGILVVALGAVWAAGGFAEGAAGGRSYAVGQRVELGRFAVTVERAEFTNAGVGEKALKDAKPWLRVWLRVDNLTDAGLDISALAGEAADPVEIIRPGAQDRLPTRPLVNGQTGWTVDPGLTRTVLLETRSWDDAPQVGQPAPASVTLRLREDRSTRSVVSELQQAVSGRVIGTIECPVTEARQ